jgi:hypothetical protein
MWGWGWAEANEQRPIDFMDRKTVCAQHPTGPHVELAGGFVGPGGHELNVMPQNSSIILIERPF